jgi:hypothetical protein
VKVGEIPAAEAGFESCYGSRYLACQSGRVAPDPVAHDNTHMRLSQLRIIAVSRPQTVETRGAVRGKDLPITEKLMVDMLSWVQFFIIEQTAEAYRRQCSDLRRPA